MALPPIILSKDQILLINSQSNTGIVPMGGKITMAFGSVQAVSDLIDGISVNDVVSYDPTKTQSFMYGSTIYLLVDQQYVTGNEGPPV